MCRRNPSPSTSTPRMPPQRSPAAADPGRGRLRHDPQIGDRAHGRARAARAGRRLERGEVVPAAEQRAGRLHRGAIDRLRQVPDVAPVEGVGYRPGGQPVAVHLPARVEAGVEPIRNLCGVQRPHGGRQPRVERPDQRGRRQRVGQAHAGNLTQRVHPRVGATGAVHGDRASLQRPQRRLDRRLNRRRAALPLPAGVVGAVVRQGELEGPHAEPGGAPGLPAGVYRRASPSRTDC